MSKNFRNKLLYKTYDEIKSIIISEHPIGLSAFLSKYGCGKAFLKKVSHGRSWNEILIECGLALNMRKPYLYDKNDIIKSVLEFEKECIENNLRFSSCTYRRSKRFSQTIIDKVFNNWGELLKEAGLYDKYYQEKNFDSLNKSNKIKLILPDKSVEYKTKDEIVDILSKNINSELNFVDYNSLKKYGITNNTIFRIFGNTNKFYTYFGLKSIKSHGENSIKSILDSLNLDYVEQYPGPKNPETNNSTYFDFYIPSLNAIIEIHGEQHYKFDKFFHRSVDNFEYRSILDNLKLKWANDNNINVFIIPKDLCTHSYVSKLLVSLTNFEIC